MEVDLFDFELPEENIALRPAVPRDASRLLVVGGDGELGDHLFKDLADFLEPGDALVFNNTRVIPAQFHGIRNRSGSVANVDITLHRRMSASQWAAFVRGARKLKPGDQVMLSGQRAD